MQIPRSNGPGLTKPPRRLTATGTFVTASVVLFLVSLTLNGYYTDGDKPDAWAPCFGLLLVGWIGVFERIPAWLANPALAIAWVLMGLRRSGLAAFALTVASLGLALSFLYHQRIMTDEAGNYARITGYGAGYWLWIASMVVALIGCLVSLHRDAAAADAS